MLQGSILQQLASAHPPEKRPLNFGVYYKNTLIALCHALEDCILASNSPPLVITAFQQGKWYLQEAQRYQEIAKNSQQVVIMAAPDTGFATHPTSQLPNVNLISLEPTDPVAQEWHLMIFSPSYTAMVLCQELSAADYGPGGQPTADLERKFYGFWTFEPALVQETVELAIAHINQYNPQLGQALTTQLQAISNSPNSQQDDLNAVVARVIDYLQTSQLDVCNQHKALDNNLVSNELQAFLRLAQLIDSADGNRMAAAEVAALAETMGQLLDLPAWQLKRLRLAGLLHRIAPLSLSVQYGEAPSCPLVPAAQVLRIMPRMQAIAQIINHLTEWWNGDGQPAGLIGEQIPLESRILGLVAEFQTQITQLAQSHQGLHPEANLLMSDQVETLPEALLTEALAACRKQEGRWEPKLVDTLELLVMGMQQGLTLAITSPKISSGMWLIDAQIAGETLKLGEADRARSEV